MAKTDIPTYTAYILDDAGTKYDLTQVLVSIDLTDQDNQMAQRAQVTIHNVMIGDVWSTSVIQVRQRIFIFADDGEKQDEVFRGFIWKKQYISSNDERDFTFTCYDNLIYFQESEDYDYFSAGKSTEDVLGAFCEKWGVELEYNYETITHEKLMLKGTLANIFENDILDPVQDRTGKKYVIRSEKDKIRILNVGLNEDIYQLLSAKNVVQTKSIQTMEGVITKVVFQGKAGADERPPVEAELEENTDKFGTLQKVVSRNESASLEDAKKEAQAMLDMFKNPFWEYEVQAPDIPWIRKGDKVYINAGDIYQMYLIVKEVQRTIDMKKGALMKLTLDDGLPKEFTPTTFSGSPEGRRKDGRSNNRQHWCDHGRNADSKPTGCGQFRLQHAICWVQFMRNLGNLGLQQYRYPLWRERLRHDRRLLLQHEQKRPQAGDDYRLRSFTMELPVRAHRSLCRQQHRPELRTWTGSDLLRRRIHRHIRASQRRLNGYVGLGRRRTTRIGGKYGNEHREIRKAHVGQGDKDSQRRYPDNDRAGAA